MVELLTNEPMRLRFAAEARRASQAYTIAAMARRWDDVLRPGPVAQQIEQRDEVAVHEPEVRGKA